MYLSINWLRSATALQALACSTMLATPQVGHKVISDRKTDRWNYGTSQEVEPWKSFILIQKCVTMSTPMVLGKHM